MHWVRAWRRPIFTAPHHAALVHGARTSSDGSERPDKLYYMVSQIALLYEQNCAEPQERSLPRQCRTAYLIVLRHYARMALAARRVPPRCLRLRN